MQKRAEKSRKLITAIICTHNRYDVLNDALGALRKQSLPPSDYEIMVVDNSSDKKAQRSFWKPASRRHLVNLKFQSEPGLSKARNVGLQAATTPLIAYCDDDAMASPRWLECLVRLFKDRPNAGIVGGPVVPIWPGSPPKWLHPWLAGYFTIVDRGESCRQLSANEWLAGTNIAFRRNLLASLGGFDERLGRRGASLLSNEEIAISRRVRDLGFAAFYEPAAVMHHKVSEDRISQAWLRRRFVWQVISNALAVENGCEWDRDHCWEAIADYALHMPPEMRNIRGLFFDTDDPDVMNRQCEAIGALAKLMLFDARDPERHPEQ